MSCHNDGSEQTATDVGVDGREGRARYIYCMAWYFDALQMNVGYHEMTRVAKIAPMASQGPRPPQGRGTSDAWRLPRTRND